MRIESIFAETPLDSLSIYLSQDISNKEEMRCMSLFYGVNLGIQKNLWDRDKGIQNGRVMIWDDERVLGDSRRERKCRL